MTTWTGCVCGYTYFWIQILYVFKSFLFFDTWTHDSDAFKGHCTAHLLYQRVFMVQHHIHNAHIQNGGIFKKYFLGKYIFFYWLNVSNWQAWERLLGQILGHGYGTVDYLVLSFLDWNIILNELVAYLKVAARVDLKLSYHKKKCNCTVM